MMTNEQEALVVATNDIHRLFKKYNSIVCSFTDVCMEQLRFHGVDYVISEITKELHFHTELSGPHARIFELVVDRRVNTASFELSYVMNNGKNPTCIIRNKKSKRVIGFTTESYRKSPVKHKKAILDAIRKM